MLGRSKRTLNDVSQRALALPLSRSAFGRWISTGARSRYARELLDTWEQEAPEEGTPWSGSLDSLRELSEATGERLDTAAERLVLAMFTTTEGLLTIMTTDSDVPAIRKAQQTFRERCTRYVSLLVCFIATDPDTADQRLAELPNLKIELREAARPMISALQSLDARAAEHAVSALHSAVIVHLIEFARAEHARRFKTLIKNA